MENRPDFTKLRIWQIAHELALEIYKISGKFPQEEKYGLISQIRRAAVSVESLIAEGHGRYHYADSIKFLIDARGSAYEVQSQLLIAVDLKYCNKSLATSVVGKYTELVKQVNSFINYKRNSKVGLTKNGNK